MTYRHTYGQSDSLKHVNARFYGKIIMLYSVMHSHRNSFCGDVVSDSSNKTSRDEENILEQICESKYARIIILMILILYNIE